MEDESKQFLDWKELWANGGDFLAGLGVDERAFRGISGMIANQMGINNTGDTVNQIEGATEDQLKKPHGMTELCKINVKGHSE